MAKENDKNSLRDINLETLIYETQGQNDALTLEINLFAKKITMMETQLNDQEKVINIKESLIKKFRTKNYHLQNYKSVYDQQMNTLKEEH